MHRFPKQKGYTLVELLLALVLGAILIAGIGSVAGKVVNTREHVTERTELIRQARFAMAQMVRMASHSRSLVLPMNDKPASNWPEHIREETVPPSPPIGSSTKATAVLSVLLPLYIDLNGDGIPDADNDGDGLIDEDLYPDMNRDGVAGIRGIDDDGDGSYDNVNWWNDDETAGWDDEDPINGVDDEGDGLVDEDSSGDMNDDGSPGVAGVDDDGDGQIDEGDVNDDDEDGEVDEDWLDTVTFFLQGDNLVQRMPITWDVTGNGKVTGWDFKESVIAEGVTRLRVERLEDTPVDVQMVDLTLELTSPDTGEMVSLNTRVRVGGAL